MRNSAASMPSRSTATNATAAMARRVLPDRMAASTLCSRSPLISRPLAAHPEDHPREHDRRRGRDGREGAEPGVALKRADADADEDADGERRQRGQGHPLPDGAGEVEAPDATQVGEDDGHHEGCFDALTHHD
jgi:hypothetical protein